MQNELLTFLFGAVGGGLVAALFRIVETYWVTPHLNENIEARKKLLLYAKPFWLDCHELEFRLKAIRAKQQSSNPQELEALKFSPRSARSVGWFTKEGYYVTSTAYLIASVAAWIVAFQQDVAFLQFGKETLTNQFFRLIEHFKAAISATPSILWYHYVDGIGERLCPEGHNRPMPFSLFCQRMYDDESFREYYDQLFLFLGCLATGQYQEQIDKVLHVLERIKSFLQENDIVPVLTDESGTA